MIEIGMTYTMEKTVTPDMTAKAVGSGGLEVFGTPFMMGLMENAAMQCVQPELPEGKGTVGVEISSSHLAPTPVGMKVSATAEVTGVSANGKMITFKVTAHDADGLIGEGTHTRAIIDNARFLQKCSESLCCFNQHINISYRFYCLILSLKLWLVDNLGIANDYTAGVEVVV